MELSTSRPRVIGWLRSAAILDGDWGTSVAYVLGIAFALAGYNSGWHLLMMLMLTAMVAVNYITICRLYPNGGGVYSSVSHRSRTLAVVGAMLLSADYVVTTSLSVLDGCHYLGLSNPELYAIAVILAIGVLNWFGPRHAGTVATLISLATLVALLILVAATGKTVTTHFHLQPMTGNPLDNWRAFVGIILSISGIEAISNMTAVMKNPTKNSRRAILAVLAKITVVTVFLTLAMLALPNVDRMAHKEIMIRFLGETYVGAWFGPLIGSVLGLLLISAGNTAINDLVSIQFLMAVDGELPRPLRLLNKYGMPVYPLIVATVIPIIVLLLINDVLTLAQLYAIGVVGAILINVGSTGTDKALSLSPLKRAFMMCSALVLFFIEVTIAVEKTKALAFALIVLAVGLTARAIARRQAVRLVVPISAPTAAVASPGAVPERTATFAFSSRILVAVRGGGERLLRQACEEAKLRHAFLVVLHVKRISVTGLIPATIPSEAIQEQRWMEDICHTYGIPHRVMTILSSEVGYTIAEQAATFGVDQLILGATQRSLMEKALRGDVIRTVSGLLPDEIQLVIYRA